MVTLRKTKNCADFVWLFLCVDRVLVNPFEKSAILNHFFQINFGLHFNVFFRSLTY